MTKLTLEAPTYQIGDILFSPTSGVIEKNQSLYKLRAKECALLDILIKQFPRLLSRNDIVESLYQNTYATDATINQLVKRLRNSLDDDKRSLIRTIPKQGYQLSIAPTCTSALAEAESIAIQHNATASFAQSESSSQSNEQEHADTPNISGKAERNLERFCGAIAVIGVFISIVSGYYYGDYAQANRVQYLEHAERTQVDPSLVLANKPVAVFDNDQLSKVILNKEDKYINCYYNSDSNVTICK
ncbi:transcriptional regulator CadC [Vibrio astriarenae]|nr:transcriptional regulator CadC [Vibrio sp. C7]